MDPFHDQIVDALGKGDFDPLVFEACMGDLLRKDIPGLVPVPGGGDAGIDGAIADGRGEPYPLVCTTSKDVLGNLTRSLRAYKKEKQWPRRQVALATSQSLTPRRRRHLEDRAESEGFTMLQVFDQRAIANRLYYSRWPRKLLGLSGRPSALSKVPKTRRPLLAIDLIGRDKEVHWLETTAGDRLLHGQPGSGKTYLACHLADQGRALFLTDTSDAHVAEALRVQKPEVVVVDDAHRNLEQLDMLRHLRDGEVGADFSILATSWSGDKDRVAAALGTIPQDRVRGLDLLPFRDILEVIRQTGIQGPDELLRVLAEQADNKPGLAVTLALLCLQGDWRWVFEGEALRTTLMPLFEDLVGSESTPFLAAVGLGGDRGMPLGVVEEFLRLDSGKAWMTASGLAAGGVLTEVERGVLAVWPRDLRSALLRQVFFGGSAVSLDYRILLERAPSFPHAVRAILDAVHRGATIPDNELRGLALRSGPTEIVPGFWSRAGVEVWQSYTSLGEGQARWALDHYPADPLDLIRYALRCTPCAAITKLLERAFDADGSLHAQPSHPLRILKDWLEDLEAPPAEWIRRRKLLVRQTKKYLQNKGDRNIGIQALFLALSPRLEGAREDLLGHYVTIRSGILPLPQLCEMSTIWEEIRDAIDTIGATNAIDAKAWPYLTDGLWNWIYPDYGVSHDLSEEYRTEMHAIAIKILTDLATSAESSPGLAAGLVRLARRMGRDLPLTLDPIFELLYPEDYNDVEDMARREAREAREVRELAAHWASTRKPEEVAESLARYESEADRIAHRKWPPRTQELCRMIAEDTSDPASWLATFVSTRLPSALIQPFLERTIILRPEGWEKPVESCLHVDACVPFSSVLILEAPEASKRLRELAFSKATTHPWLVERLCSRSKLSLETLTKLLLHPDWKVAVAGAIGTWLAEPQGQIREEVSKEWRKAILRTSGDEKELESFGFQHWMREIFGRNSDLAFNWIRKLLEDRLLQSRLLGRGSVLDTALDALEEDHRLGLLKLLEEPQHIHRILLRLVGRDTVIYQHLLSISPLRRYQLVPLEGIPDSQWAEWALLALAEGHDPQAVADAAFGTSPSTHSLSGPEQSYWRRWDQAFAELETHPNEKIREIAGYGRVRARQYIEAADQQQKDRDLRPPS